MSTLKKSVVLCAAVTLSLAGCSAMQRGPKIQEGSEVIGGIGKVVNLDQNWTTDSQQAFYFTTQGSRILPYAWYLALEQANNQTLFRDNDHIAALRYIPSKKSSWNPDGLAVGFVKDGQGKQAWMGFTCAACHTTQVHYKNTGIRIDGGPSLGDFENFNIELVDAMNATYKSDTKFTRFAKSVLGNNATPNDKTMLRNQLLQQSLVLAQRNKINHPDKNQPHYGYGRVDAIGAIFNQILSKFNDLPNNGRISNAPVSYPFLWGTHQSDVVQWTGFAPNGPYSLGALVRNGGEVLGVYGQLDIPNDKSVKHYKSSLQIKNLGRLESWVAQLRSPIWPAEILPPIDPAKAEKGQTHYNKYCLSCHQVIPWSEQDQKYKAVLTPLSKIGTDPQEIINVVKLRDAGKFVGRKEGVLFGDTIPAKTAGLPALVNAVIGSLLEHPLESLEAAIIEYEGGKDSGAISGSLNKHLETTVSMYNRKSLPTDDKEVAKGMVYKARPLTGIWATAPYMHNGSIPNLAEVLLPAKKRSTVFYLGSRELDPVKVGFVSDPNLPDTKVFKFDTRLTGNSNSGHEYGTNLSDEERQELVEYLKTL
ncbi:MAG: di-heme-cytochrome C peroxidase [Gammaproteobacteria bacterium]|nr:di-heme-cytochrome C peroxidase [Gammaproteobacteria bacterium]MDH5650634.1 di-heme-cytochrome C peroxidase [Gammaproteobacteria bacterium]